jgi:serine/threonine protein kinase
MLKLAASQTVMSSYRTYLSPEFKQNGTISKKLDIFSLGLIIIEIISGQRIYCDNIGTPNEEFIEVTANFIL